MLPGDVPSEHCSSRCHRWNPRSRSLTLASCSEPAAPEAGGDGDGAGGTLTVYTSEPQAKIDALNAEFTAENPGIDVQVFRAGTGDLNARIASERQTGSIGADVLLAADAPTFEKYKADDLLLQYTPADVDALDPNVVDPDGYYVGTRIIPTVIAYNTGTASQPPTSWKDLADPQYKGRITLPNPDVSARQRSTPPSGWVRKTSAFRGSPTWSPTNPWSPRATAPSLRPSRPAPSLSG
ncbi:MULTISPECIES: extracellular solute-binding protein [unclassified Rhodococcus (in: high G+C Gram-positive bacteria)]|uniref:extracellular solute-binding protein n=1 Tax=unclassified Rhodococcus (in: high G+C Gram-positive bacteria) TaxID=192944 RepID=UPI00295567BD|nr:extracellular solute-binding protein [Rhodococcus sp. IEGM 1414]MDV8036041.1 extracellular solute-binding protein [Rhodococcus sp. IEGM 1414]